MQRGTLTRVVVPATLALFLTVFALLIFQLRSGRDPALGGEVAQTNAAAPKKKRLLIRTVIVTRRVVHLPAEAPTTRTSTPAPPPSAPAPAPTPAPAPAPLTSQSS